MRRSLTLLAACPRVLSVGFALAQVGCSPTPTPSWRDQLVADSPCYRVNLLDGIDAEGTSEIDALYACIDRDGHLDPFDATWAAADGTTRAGDPGHQELARAIQGAADVDIDVFANLSAALDLVQDESLRADLVDVALELSWAAPAPFLRDGGVSFASATALTEGVLDPALTVAPDVARRLLDTPDTRAALRELVEHPDLRRTVLTLGAVARSDHAPLADGLFRHVGSALAATSSPQNDRWTRASGQSLRDVATVFLDGASPVIDDLRPPVLELLDDASLGRRIGATLRTLERQEHLAPFMSQLAGLADVNVEGRPLARGEDSALTALARLLGSTNAPMRCSLDLWLTDLEVDLGNVAVALLDLVADWEPETVQDASGLVGDLLGYDLASWVVDQVVDAGVCPLITPQTIEDLEALDRLYDPGKRSLVTGFLALLAEVDADFPERDADHLQAVADLATVLWRADAMPPVEEVLRDTAGEPLIADATALIAILVAPDDLDVDDPADWEVVLTAARATLDDRDGPSGWDRLAPVILPLVRADDTWRAVDASARVLAHPQSTLGGAGAWLPRFIEYDPDLSVLMTLGTLLGHPDVADPLLRVLERRPVADALRAPGADQPIGWLSARAVDGTLDELFATIDLLIDQVANANQHAVPPR